MANNTPNNGSTDTNTKEESMYKAPAEVAKMIDIELAMSIVRRRRAEGFAQDTEAEVKPNAPKQSIDVAALLAATEDIDSLSLEDAKALSLGLAKVVRDKATKPEKSLRLRQEEWEFKTRIWEGMPHPYADKVVKNETDPDLKATMKAANEDVDEKRKLATARFFKLANRFVDEQDAGVKINVKS